MDGILLVDKPKGWTSHDVVAKIRGIIKAERGQKIKVGHTGTLDPAATGLMIVVVGSYCKRAAEFSKLDKTYEVEITLGIKSSTGDKEGELTKISARQPSKQEVDSTLNKFMGKISQTPPAFSAIKVDGKRAYKLAREGKVLKMEPREVTIYSIEDVSYNYPKIKFTTTVSSGTYIRSLAEDIGDQLGTGGYLSNLRRVRVSKYTVDRALHIDKNTNYDIIIDGIQTPPKV